MKKLIILAVLGVLLFSGFIPQTYTLPKSAWKKVNKELSKLWPEVELVKEEVALDHCQLYKLKHNEGIEGYLLISKAPSRYDDFDYMLVYNPDLSIKHASILIYRESYGGEIGSFRWLRQFIGYSNKSAFELGNDVQGISGATISCRAAAQGFKKSTALLVKLKQEEQL